MQVARNKDDIEWTDNNSKSTWISVDEDLPYNHKELLNAKYQTKEVFVFFLFNRYI